MPNVVSNTAFKTKGSWVNEFIDTETVVEGEDRHDRLLALAEANKVNVKTYPNLGMYRMNIGNMLRASARRRGGLHTIDGDFVVWEEIENPTHDPDGNKILAVEAAAE